MEGNALRWALRGPSSAYDDSATAAGSALRNTVASGFVVEDDAGDVDCVGLGLGLEEMEWYRGRNEETGETMRSKGTFQAAVISWVGTRIAAYWSWFG